MPWCIAYGCDNSTHKSLPGISFHRLPLNNGPLLKQVRLLSGHELRENIEYYLQWLAKLRLENPPINDKNARVCSEHFFENDFVTAVLPGFGPAKPTLKPEAVPTKFSFVPVPKRRKTSELRIARAAHQNIIEELTSTSLLNDPPVSSISSASDGEAVMDSTEYVVPVKPATRDVGIQCDIKPSLSKSPPQFAHFYPEPIIQHDVSTQADMFLACSSPKEVELEEKEGNPVDMTATTISYNEDTAQSIIDTDDNDTAENIATDDLQKERKFLVFESCLLSLFSQCYKCGLEVELKTSIRGTLLVVNGSCPHGHEVYWQSQPTVKNMGAGNLLLPAAILFSGLTFTSFANMAGLLNVPMISESYFYRIQKQYLYPVVHGTYLLQQEAVLAFLRDEGLHLSGDGRCDSPGYSAKYCTYSIMDSVSDLILDYKLVQSSETGSSVAMEKEGLRRCLDYLLANNVQILSIATDRHRGVGSLMKKEYPFIEHQFDVWHLAKNVVKKLTQKGKQKHCEQLLPWIQSISNHLWWSAQTCNGNAQLLTDKWVSIVHHISNVHEWVGDEGSQFTKCVHPTLTPEEQRSKKWLRSGSVVHRTLSNVVTDTTLLKDIKKLTGFHHTGSLEVFHSLLLKYCPKRQHFSYMGMQARIELTILDHNYNTERKHATTKKGDKRYNIVFPKGRKQWIARPVLEGKNYKHLLIMMDDVIQLRLKDDRQDLQEYTLPDSIPRNIASIPKPSKEEVVQAHITRFCTGMTTTNTSATTTTSASTTANNNQ